MVLFDETGEGGGASYAVYLRATDESPAVRLGDGHALALSPDGRWALSTPQSEPAQLVLLPTGAGTPRGIPTGAFDAVLRAAFLPGGERLVLSANEPGRALRLYVQRAEGGAPRPITPENVGAEWAVSPDGLRVAAVDARGALVAYAVDGGGGGAGGGGAADPAPIPGAIAGDSPVRFSPEGRSLYVLARGDGAACTIDRLDLATGRRERWKAIQPPDPVGVYGIPRLLLSADGASYVYAYVRLLDDLYLVDGLR
jgi:hypothetical protein